MVQRSSLRAFALIFAATWFSTSAVATAAERSVKDWQVRGTGKQVMSGTGYSLYNVTEKNAVRYGDRTWGINLVWEKKQQNNIKVVSQGNAKGPIKYGDKVAIHVEKGGYLKYQKRDVGINLVWSKTPVHEFVITGGKKGTPVAMNATIALYNSVEKDFIVRADRPAGISLRWYKDRDKGGLGAVIKNTAKDLVKEGLKELADEFIGK
jgi:hypothetical protein